MKVYLGLKAIPELRGLPRGERRKRWRRAWIMLLSDVRLYLFAFAIWGIGGGGLSAVMTAIDAMVPRVALGLLVVSALVFGSWLVVVRIARPLIGEDLLSDPPRE